MACIRKVQRLSTTINPYVAADGRSAGELDKTPPLPCVLLYGAALCTFGTRKSALRLYGRSWQ